MKITELTLPGAKIIEPDYFDDSRGYFFEPYSARTLAKMGIKATFVQDSQSRSLKKGTLRGIHFQNNPASQSRIVRCLRGKIKDVIVDLRKDSQTYKCWQSFVLSPESRTQIWIPSGFGHAFLTLEDNCEVFYKFTGLYEPAYDRAIAWDDPEIGIDWGITNPILSAKDAGAPLLAESDVNLTTELNPD